MKWLDRSEYPFESKYFDMNGYRQHYIDEGAGHPIVFVHGTPSWSFDFRNVIRELRSRFRCIAVDHIGFGLSDKPENYDYSTINHSKTLEALVHHLRLEKITIVLHDFGGPIGFRLAIDNPSLVKNFVVLNSWMWSSEHDPAFQSMKRILKSPLLPFLYLRLNFSARFLLPASFGEKKISKKIHRHYTGAFSNASERHGTLAFARSLLNDQLWFESLWNRREIIASQSTLLIWGMRDKFVGENYLERFTTVFRSAVIKRLETAGHFPQEEQPQAVAAAILEFLEVDKTNGLVENDGSVSVDENTIVKH